MKNMEEPAASKALDQLDQGQSFVVVVAVEGLDKDQNYLMVEVQVVHCFDCNLEVLEMKVSVEQCWLSVSQVGFVHMEAF